VHDVGQADLEATCATTTAAHGSVSTCSVALRMAHPMRALVSGSSVHLRLRLPGLGPRFALGSSVIAATFAPAPSRPCVCTSPRTEVSSRARPDVALALPGQR
jgi:hypothetical protein